MIGENEIVTSRGVTIWWKDNGAGGRSYYSDECGDGVLIWDTCLVSIDCLIAAFEIEKNLLNKELIEIFKRGTI